MWAEWRDCSHQQTQPPSWYTCLYCLVPHLCPLLQLGTSGLPEVSLKCSCLWSSPSVSKRVLRQAGQAEASSQVPGPFPHPLQPSLGGQRVGQQQGSSWAVAAK